MALEMSIRIGALRSFKRLSYTPWHALAEFVDNSTQSYYLHEGELNGAWEGTDERLTVRITYDSLQNGPLVITDNALGMDFAELQHAMVVGDPPDRPWRSRYGFGLKTAASWFGDIWSVDTKKLGATSGYRVTVNVDEVATGAVGLPYEEYPSEVGAHYTTITIPSLRHPLHSRTRGKVREFLQSMYRDDLRSGRLSLFWLGEELRWDEQFQFAEEDGVPLRLDFEFTEAGKLIRGWAGVLMKGGRPKAGFSILHNRRVIRGTPDAWRPEAIYGPSPGSNDLVNQRLVGEIDLSAFEVSHTKDFVSWEGDEEQAVEFALRRAVQELIDAANRLRRPSRLPGAASVKRVINDLQGDLVSESVQRAVVQPAENALEQSSSARASLIARARRRSPDFTASFDGITVVGHLLLQASPDDDYLAVDSSVPGILAVVINGRHPHLSGIKTDGLMDHVEHCVYQALGEWQARTRADASDAASVRAFQSLLMKAAARSSTGTVTDS